MTVTFPSTTSFAGITVSLYVNSVLVSTLPLPGTSGTIAQVLFSSVNLGATSDKVSASVSGPFPTKIADVPFEYGLTFYGSTDKQCIADPVAPAGTFATYATPLGACTADTASGTSIKFSATATSKFLVQAWLNGACNGTVGYTTTVNLCDCFNIPNYPYALVFSPPSQCSAGVWAGNYSGTYTGAKSSGSWSNIITPYAVVSQTITATGGTPYTVGGSIQFNGALSAGALVGSGVSIQFQGAAAGSGSAVTISGTWSSTSQTGSDSGSFSGTRQ